MKTDLLELFENLFNGTIHECKLDIMPDYSVCVVAASKGYPLEYEKGKVINGLDNITSLVFHAGTTIKNNQIVTNGGRVLVVNAQGPTLKDAKTRVYDTIQKISFENMYYRSDIGFEF